MAGPRTLARSPQTPLFGRDRELRHLLQVAGVAEPVPPAALLLSGDAGIGKTRLIEEAVGRAIEAGQQVLVGHCLDLGDNAMPYQPFIEALGLLHAEQVASLATELRALAPLLPSGSGEATGQGVDRTELFAAVVAGLDLLAADRPLLVIVEDAHWADGSTRQLLRYLLACRFANSVHLIVSYRSDDLHRRHPLREAVAEWARMPTVSRLELGPLADGDIVELVRARGADPAGSDLGAVVRRAAGNAFYAEELRDAGADATLPETLAELLLVRIDRLDDEATAVVRAVACAGADPSDTVLAQVTGLDGADLDRALRAAVDQKVLVAGRQDGYRFRHALLAEAVHDDLLPGERRRLHRRFLDALQRADRPAPAAEVALHAHAAAELGVAFTADLQAGDDAVRVGGYDEASRHYRRALTVADHAPSGTDLVGVVLAAADALVASGMYRTATAFLREHLDELPAADAVSRGRLLVGAGNTAYYAGRDDDADRASAAALDVIPDAPTVLRAQVDALRARVLASMRRDPEAAVHAEHALAAAEGLHAADVVSDAAATLARLAVRGGGDPAQVRRRFAELVEVSRAEGHVLGELRGLHQLAFLHYADGELDASEQLFRELLDRAEATGWAWGPYGFDGRVFAAVIDHIRGRWDDVLALTAVSPDVPMLGQATVGAVALLVAAGRGDPTGLGRAPRLRAMWDQDTVLAVHSAAAMIDLHGDVGDHRAAEAVHDELIEVMTEVWREPRFHARIRNGALLVGQFAAAAPRLAHPEQAHLVERAAAEDQQIALILAGDPSLGPEARAWAGRVHAELARLRWITGIDAPSLTELEQSWRDTVDDFTALGQVFEQARSETRLAAILAATGRAAEAEQLLAAARHTAKALGARPLLDEIVRTAGRPARLDTGLTTREMEVLGQVAAGRSNGEIAARLFISPKTVSVHVSNILAKLGATSRTEAAALGRERGLLDR